jgi:hypothetical protein
MATVVGAVCGVALAALFVASVRIQFFDAADLHRHRSPLGLLRQYRLFSPAPVRADIHLLVRDLDQLGRALPVREVTSIRLRRPVDTLWNPRRRRWLPWRAAMLELAAFTTDLADDRAAVQVAPAYLAVLGVATAEPAEGAAACQFLFVERFGTDPARSPVVLFCSAVHRLEGGGDGR